MKSKKEIEKMIEKCSCECKCLTQLAMNKAVIVALNWVIGKKVKEAIVIELE